MLKYKILKAINEGINKSLIDFANQEDIQFNKSNSFQAGNKEVNNKIKKYMDFVDLDLPSGTLWCKHNLGSTNERNAESWYGNYYAWGETEPKSSYTQDNYNKQNYEKEYICPNEDPVKLNISCASIPSHYQIDELIKYTDQQWIENYKGIEGLNGMKFTGKNFEYIFLPAAGIYVIDEIKQIGTTGYYMSSDKDEYSIRAYSLYFDDSEYIDIMTMKKSKGFTIRPIIKK